MGGGWLVVNADDLGVSESATSGILKSHREGIVTSASLAVTTPFYRDAVDRCVRACPDLGIGLHFTLTSGTPAAPADQVPALVGADGRFRWRFVSLLLSAGIARRADLLEQIGIELEAQLARLRADGITPDHIDGERHVQLIPGIFELVVAAARRHGVPYVRAGRDFGFRAFRPADVLETVANGGLVKSAILSALGARARAHLSGTGVKSPGFLSSYLYSGRPRAVARTIEAAPAELVELMVHPGLPSAGPSVDVGNRELESYLLSEDRRLETEACLLPRSALGAWRLTTYRELARRGDPR
jgi:predicted glycoside hydrolase/deacetylase ChbG (UPF0249 family)